MTAGEIHADLTGRVALVTGGTRGIGRAIAEALLRNGARVAVAARSAGEVERAERELGALGEAIGIVADISKPDDAAAMVDRTIDRFGGLQVLVNNAGISPFYKRAEQIELEEFAAILDVNVLGTFLCTRQAGRHMIERGEGGRIINVTSASGVRGVERLLAYSASKGALQRMTEVLALEWAQHAILVNSIAPGWIETDFNRQLLQSRHGDRIREHIPLRRWGTPEDVSGLAVYLASDASTLVTGQTFVIDAGYTIF